MLTSSRPAKAVLRIAKVKSLSSLDRLSRHDARTQPVSNDDPDRGGVVWLTEATDPAAAVRAEIASLDKPPSKNAVLATQTIITARAEWFGEGPDRAVKAKAFTEAAMAWAAANLPGKIVAAVRHDGEAAPHLHIWSVPVVVKELAVNRKRPELGKRPVRCLGHADLYGRAMADNRAIMTGLQTGIGEALKPLGIERGTPRSIAHADHKTTQAWKAEQAKAAKEAAAARDAIKQAEAERERMAAQASLLLAEREALLHEAAKEAAETKADRKAAEEALGMAVAERTSAEAYAAHTLGKAAADKAAARNAKAVASAYEAGGRAFAKGEILDALGQPGDLTPVFAAEVNQTRRNEIETAIKPDRQGVLAWIADLAASIGDAVRDRIADLLKAARPLAASEIARANLAKELFDQAREQAPRQRQERAREL